MMLTLGQYSLKLARCVPIFNFSRLIVGKLITGENTIWHISISSVIKELYQRSLFAQRLDRMNGKNLRNNLAWAALYFNL